MPRGGGRKPINDPPSHTWFWRRANPDKAREVARRSHQRSRLSRRGFTEESYAIAIASQDGRCAVCRNPTAQFHIDHDHRTGKTRELLCGNCNKAIGLVGESVETLGRAIIYLNKYKSI